MLKVDSSLGVSLNYATLATTGLPSGVSIQATAKILDKKLGMYVSIHENIVDDFVNPFNGEFWN